MTKNEFKKNCSNPNPIISHSNTIFQGNNLPLLIPDKLLHENFHNPLIISSFEHPNYLLTAKKRMHSLCFLSPMSQTNTPYSPHLYLMFALNHEIIQILSAYDLSRVFTQGFYPLVLVEDWMFVC